MSKLIFVAAVFAVAASKGANNGQNNADCTSCGQGNGAADINDPAFQEALGNLAVELPFISNMGLGNAPAAAPSRGSDTVLTASVPASLECPIPQTFFETTRSEPNCATNADCNVNNQEVCCNWFGVKHCLPGIATAAKAGSCPAAQARGLPCIADFGGCRFDSECNANEKCCINPDCGYGECTAPVASAPTSAPTAAPTTTPTSTPAPVVCTRVGCPPTPSPNCVNIGETFPNGPRCPSCRVCNDPPPTTTTEAVPCTRIGCPSPPHSGCVNIGETFPNGPRCPSCRVCNDPPPTTTTQAVPCTRIGCPPPPHSGCVNIGETFPNGPRCPSCRVCNDPPPTTTTEAVLCPLIACQPLPHSGCVNIGESFPNGPRCPSCRVCNDPPPTTTTQAVPCTLIACPSPPHSGCINIGETFPNGPRCPSCPVCNDPSAPVSPAPTSSCPEMSCPPAPSSSCADVGFTFPNGNRCPACSVCNDPTTPPQTPNLSMGVCRTALLYYTTQLNDCTNFSHSSSQPTGNAGASRRKQSCGAGTLFDLKMCLCNHSRLVNIATCRST